MKEKFWIANIFIVFTVISILVSIYYINSRFGNKTTVVDVKNDYIQVIGLDAENYPATAQEVVDINSNILKIVLSQKTDKDELKVFVDKQRMLFSNRLNKELSEETHISLFYEAIQSNAAEGIKLIDVRNNVTDDYEEEGKKEKIEVIQIFSNKPMKKVRYYVIYEKEQYKIDNWIFMED